MSCVTTVSVVTGVSTFLEFDVTTITVLCGLIVTNVTTSSISVVVGAIAASEPPASPLDGSQSSSVMIGE